MFGSKLPDERRRLLPKRSIISQGLHPHPGPVAKECGFDDPEGPGWDEVEEDGKTEEVHHEDAQDLLDDLDGHDYALDAA